MEYLMFSRMYEVEVCSWGLWSNLKEWAPCCLPLLSQSHVNTRHGSSSCLVCGHIALGKCTWMPYFWTNKYGNVSAFVHVGVRTNLTTTWFKQHKQKTIVHYSMLLCPVPNSFIRWIIAQAAAWNLGIDCQPALGAGTTSRRDARSRCTFLVVEQHSRRNWVLYWWIINWWTQDVFQRLNKLMVHQSIDWFACIPWWISWWRVSVRSLAISWGTTTSAIPKQLSSSW